MHYCRRKSHGFNLAVYVYGRFTFSRRLLPVGKNCDHKSFFKTVKRGFGSVYSVVVRCVASFQLSDTAVQVFDNYIDFNAVYTVQAV